MDDYVMVPREVVEFLNGSAPLDGVWFGEPHPTERGQFWWRNRLAAAPQQQAEQVRCLRCGFENYIMQGKAMAQITEADKAQQVEPALIGSDLFPSTIRLADGRDVQLGELVRRAAHGLEAAQWNLLPQKARDSAMVKALDDWQRGLTTQQQAEPAQMPIARITVRGNAADLVNLYAPGLPDGEHDLFCAPCSPDGQWAPSMFAEQQAEPDIDDLNIGGQLQVVGRLKGVQKQQGSPRITTAQVEQIKRLADEYVKSTGWHALGDGPGQLPAIRLARDALHAALDALVKGE